MFVNDCIKDHSFFLIERDPTYLTMIFFGFLSFWLLHSLLHAVFEARVLPLYRGIIINVKQKHTYNKYLFVSYILTNLVQGIK